MQVVPAPIAPTIKVPSDFDGVITEETKEGEVQVVGLSEDSPLLEAPKITDSQGEIKQGLTVEDQIIIQAYVNYYFKVSPKDEVRAELLKPYIQACMNESQNWLVFSQALLLRSRNELEKVKTKERSVLQV